MIGKASVSKCDNGHLLEILVTCEMERRNSAYIIEFFGCWAWH